ncbi:hypothetical protein [Paractinoplanes ferrugineus]|uniref:hypothetical protein n=1 Tax=Paractinoplanes ferrugineus TaxID=113564 RepID=UPI0019435466|nr:hypothetical protein [Actinoplanes ferrugineus]
MDADTNLEPVEGVVDGPGFLVGVVARVGQHVGARRRGDVAGVGARAGDLGRRGVSGRAGGRRAGDSLIG